jgi:hypothetical protein
MAGIDEKEEQNVKRCRREVMRLRKTKMRGK